jgi:hypothetical protein
MAASKTGVAYLMPLNALSGTGLQSLRSGSRLLMKKWPAIAV